MELGFFDVFPHFGAQVTLPVKSTFTSNGVLFFSNELLEASRKSLLLPLPHINLKFEKSDDILRFAVDKIGLYGGAVDMPELQKAAAHPVFGKAALVALRTIRERL